jgi:hypothetical protein
MQTYEIEVPGTLHRRWPSGETVTMLDCLLVPGNHDHEYFARTEVEAEDEEAARLIGLERCQDATNLLELCMDEQVNLDPARNHVRLKGSFISTGTASFLVGAQIVSNEPPTPEQRRAIVNAQKTIETEKSAAKKQLLIRAIHWYTIGCRETQSPIDQFIMFWVALEVLIEGHGANVSSKMKAHLDVLYPTANQGRLDRVVATLNGTRASILHEGTRQPKQFDTRLKQLEAVVKDLLRARLNLPFKALSEQYFK